MNTLLSAYVLGLVYVDSYMDDAQGYVRSTLHPFYIITCKNICEKIINEMIKNSNKYILSRETRSLFFYF